MSAVYALAQNRWAGPLFLLVSSLALPLLFQSSELFWGIAVLGVGTSIWGAVSNNRWLIALVAAFTTSLAAFSLRSGDGIGATLAFLLVLLAGSALTLWLLPTRTELDIVLGYAGGIALLQLFLILSFWPVNYPSRAILLTTGAFLLFELVEQRSSRRSAKSFVGSIGFAAVAIATVILTADWYSF